MIRPATFAFVLLVLTSSIPQPACAQWQLDGVPVSTAIGSQARPAVVRNGGGAFVVWSDARTAPSRIRVQRLSGAGEAMWAADGIEIAPSGPDQVFPVAVGDGAGGVIIGYLQINSSSQTDVNAQRLDGTGARLWGAAGVPVCTAVGKRSLPAIISDGRISGLQTPGAIIAWRDDRGPETKIYAQAIDMDGVARWTTNGVVVSFDPGVEGNFVMVSDGIAATQTSPRGMILAYEKTLFASSKTIFAQRLDAAGAQQWGSGVVLGIGATNQTFPAIALAGSGTAIAAWTDLRNGIAQVYAQKVANNAVSWAASGVPVCPSMTNQSSVSVASDGVGGGILAFLDTRVTIRGVYAQRIDGDGTLRWSAGGAVVADVQTLAQFLPMFSSTSGSAIVGWDDTRANGAPGLHAQKIDSTGAMLWNPNGAPICVAAGSHGHVVAASDSTGGAILAWEDVRNGVSDFNIYANRIQGGGGLVAVDPSVNASLRLSSPFPNPGTGQVAFRLDLPGPCAFAAQVFDPRGRLVATLARDRTDVGGSRNLVWERRSTTGERALAGVYFLYVEAGKARVTRRFVLLD